ncbi:MAG: hypothetical protein LJE68_16170 [Rhodobacter sp.]|jgi:uncharacterized membrane protein|nr:hypothetical protein [Rhodobacter sp.]
MLSRSIALCLCAALPVSAFADPGYYRVTGVASDDTLNVRSDPSAGSADLGDLPHDATGIEVSETDASGKWGRIIWEEGNGWIAMRFLAPDAVAQVGGTALPAGLLCSGTEPFWSMQMSNASATYSDTSGAVLAMTLQGARVAEGRQNFPVQTGFAGTDGSANALIAPALCSDGMSDRDYPWRVDLLISAGGTGRYLVGCCNLPLEVGSH